MDKELKAKWVAALRSGKYQQGKGVLRNAAGGFCCLGVLCDLIDPNGWSTEVEKRFSYSLDKDYDCLPFRGGMSLELTDEFMRDQCGGQLNQGTVAEMNDTGKTFAEIADYIEAQIPIG